jgi:predicted chitinase
MTKQTIKQTIDASNDQAIIEADINLYQSDIRHQSAAFLAKIATESKRQKRSKIKLVAVLEA